MRELDDLKYNCTRRHFLSSDEPGHRRARARLAARSDAAVRRDRPPAGRDAAGPLLPAPHFVRPRETRDLPVSERRAVAARPVRLQAAAADDERRGAARIRAQGQRLTGMTAQPAVVPAGRLAVRVRTARAAGAWVSDLLPHTAKIVDDCASSSRCTPRRSTTTRRSRSSRPVAAGRPAGDGRVAVVRPRDGQREPAGVRRADVARARGRSAAVLAAVGQRLPAVAAPGRAVPRRQGPGAVPRRSRRRQPDHAPADARHAALARGARARTGRAIPRSTRGSRSTRWRSGCRPRCRK